MLFPTECLRSQAWQCWLFLNHLKVFVAALAALTDPITPLIDPITAALTDPITRHHLKQCHFVSSFYRITVQKENGIVILNLNFKFPV